MNINESCAEVEFHVGLYQVIMCIPMIITDGNLIYITWLKCNHIQATWRANVYRDRIEISEIF